MLTAAEESPYGREGFFGCYRLCECCVIEHDADAIADYCPLHGTYLLGRDAISFDRPWVTGLHPRAVQP